MGTTQSVACVLCGQAARRWRDQQDRLGGTYRYRCAACGGRFAVTGEALDQLHRGTWETAKLLTTVRSQIRAGVLPRIVDGGGRPRVEPAGRQAY